MDIRLISYILIALIGFYISSYALADSLTFSPKAEVIRSKEAQSGKSISFNLVDLHKLYKLNTNDAVIKSSTSQAGFLHIISGTSKQWPGITIKPPSKKYWDFTQYSEIVLTVRNFDVTTLTLFLRADSPLLTNKQLRPWLTQRITIPAKETRDIRLKLTRQTTIVPNLLGMQVLPSGFSASGFEPSKISQLIIFLNRSSISRSFEIGNLRAVGQYYDKPWERLHKKEFFPFVDQFGQFQHADWPNKVFSRNDLVAQRELEATDLENHQRPIDWNKYGGWIKGPRFKATQHFRVEKVDKVWWFIDPDGYLFWSHGIDVVGNSDKTIITDRENYYYDLSDNRLYFNDLFTDVKKHEIKKGHYRGRDDLKAYDFFQSNLRKKYGSDWNKDNNELIHKRLGSWGVNTLGLWSARDITSMRKTPYVEWLYYQAPKIKGKGKYQSNMVDMWDPEFINHLEKTVNKIKQLKKDPWCIGVFVDNELPWKDAKSFAAMVLSAPTNQPAKIKFIELLNLKYETIDAFNEQWKTKQNSWAVLDAPTILIDEDIPWDIANEFYKMSAEQYYKTVRTFIKQHAPDLLYLGSRLNGEFPIPAVEAAKYADVVSYNLYRNDVGDFIPPNKIDKPILIGEWHFGSDDRGVFGTGLVTANSQKDRAEKFKYYLESAIANPYIIGAHWFQYMDQPTTGRISNEENHQIGFISITDTPYHETIEASRKIGTKIYTDRQKQIEKL